MWWDLKKVIAIVAIIAVAAVISVMTFLGSPGVKTQTVTITVPVSQHGQKLDYVVKLRVVGDRCIIRVDTPPIPYSIRWPWVPQNFTSSGAGGYYAYLLLINETTVGIAPAIARAYNSSLYFVFKCTMSNGMLVYEASPTFINRTGNGFNEQYTVGVDFGGCETNYCEFGWRRWTFVAKYVYVFLNWYYTPINGYLLPAIGGVPYKVVW